MLHRFLMVVCTLAVLAETARAEPPPLAPQRSSLVQVSSFVRYDRLPGDVDGGRAGLSVRSLIGHSIGYCAGADLEFGGTEQGVSYGAVLHLTGVGVRLGEVGVVSLCGGLGAGGARGVVPAALELPVEARARVQLGPLHTTAWATGRWTSFADARNAGSRFDAVDELEVGLSLGWGTQRRYWRGSSAGGGPQVGAVYRELMGERVFAVVLGLDLMGAN
jgi:hypothetical protein